MSTLSFVSRVVAAAGIALALSAAAGCGGDGKCEGSGDKCKPGPSAAGEFESDLPGNGDGLDFMGLSESSRSGGAAPGAQSAGDAAADGDDGANRAIVEADVIQLEGDKLYALSRVAGLAIVDAENPARLGLLGRYRELPGQPFEMYLRGEVAILMFAGWGQYVASDDDDGSYSYVATSKVLALDVSDPGAINMLGSFDVPGTISDSRIVGDVLYVVGYEDGYCWRCDDQKPTTTITSLDVSDPRQMRKVDELRYVDRNEAYSWQRSISVTDRRMYVAGPQYGQNGPVGSTIQVVDISDPSGDLVEGAALAARGQISSRWQMDEYDGVLRVVSQSGRWRTGELPMLQTFRVISSREFEPLAQLGIVLPRPETLQSARFDGERGYVITAERKDPLFTLDLSDPKHPRQLGELEMPGWIYHMEPRGDRVLGLGFDQGNPEGSITVSLFDVSDLSTPTMLGRVNFGGDWGSLPEDQDRIHKVFRILPELGLILVPYSGYEQSPESEFCGGKSLGGVQLVDYADDTLRLRGSASTVADSRRALVHRDHVLSIGDQRVESFTLADRDKPARAGQLVMSNWTQLAEQLSGDVVARITQPNQGAIIELVSAAQAEDPNAKLAELSLDKLLGNGPTADCEGGEAWIESAHADGSTLYVAYRSYGRTARGEQRGIMAIDASDPKKPQLVSKLSWPLDEWYPYYGSYSYAGFRAGQQQAMWHAGAYVQLEQHARPSTTGYDLRLRVVDLRDARKLAATTLALPSSVQYISLLADGDRVLTSHFEPVTAKSPRGRYYIDGFDISNPSAPRALPPINVPGALVHFDSASGRAVTSELRRISTFELSYEACRERFLNPEFRAQSRTSDGAPVGTCTAYTERLHLVELVDQGAVLEDTLELDEGQRVSSVSGADGLLFATLASDSGYSGFGGRLIADCEGPCGGHTPGKPSELLVLSGFDAGELRVGRITVGERDAWWGWWGAPPVHAYGQRALVVSQTDIAIIDASDPTAPRIERTTPLLGSVQSVDLGADAALLALGEQGAQWIEL